jgi:hypothetical protein
MAARIRNLDIGWKCSAVHRNRFKPRGGVVIQRCSSDRRIQSPSDAMSMSKMATPTRNRTRVVHTIASHHSY